MKKIFIYVIFGLFLNFTILKTNTNASLSGQIIGTTLGQAVAFVWLNDEDGHLSYRKDDYGLYARISVLFMKLNFDFLDKKKVDKNIYKIYLNIEEMVNKAELLLKKIDNKDSLDNQDKNILEVKSNLKKVVDKYKNFLIEYKDKYEIGKKKHYLNLFLTISMASIFIYYVCKKYIFNEKENEKYENNYLIRGY